MTCENHESLCQLHRRRKRAEGDEENDLCNVKKVKTDAHNNTNNNITPNNSNSNSNGNSWAEDRLQIESEFKVLQSLIPGVSKQENVSEVRLDY